MMLHYLAHALVVAGAFIATFGPDIGNLLILLGKFLGH